MPHQCLKCGKVFPSGSPEILKGCNECGGKKFFYTEQPVSDEERERLIEQANKDIKVLIHEILAQSQREDLKFFDSNGEPVSGRPGKGGADWVKVSPPGMAKGGVSTGMRAEEKTRLKSEEKIPTVKQILQELKSKTELELEPEIPKTKEKEVPGKVKVGKKEKYTGKAKRKIKRGFKVKKRRRGLRPEIITVSEPGVYNIQLDKLMKGFPIIINRDGTYLLHLPSVFESIEKDKKK